MFVIMKMYSFSLFVYYHVFSIYVYMFTKEYLKFK